MTEFTALVDLCSAAAFAIDGNLRIVAWNAPLECLLGYSREEVLGRNCYDVLQARLPNGESLCTPDCEGKHCFEHCTPIAVPACLARCKGDAWVKASLSTLVSPVALGNSSASEAVAIVFLHQREETASLNCGNDRLRVYTLGQFGLSVKGCSLPTIRWHRKQALTLLKILVTHGGGTLHRNQLIEWLWPGADERRGCQRLKVTTYFLRERLREAGLRGDSVLVSGASYSLKRETVWLDWKAFMDFFREGKLFEQKGHLKAALSHFEKAKRLYAGDYLPEDRYADWCAETREYLREVYLDLLGHLVHGYLEGGDNERAVEICRLGLAYEPYREGFHRALMVCLARLGQHDLAVAHYRRCREMLEAELGVEPAPETERVYRELSAAH